MVAFGAPPEKPEKPAKKPDKPEKPKKPAPNDPVVVPVPPVVVVTPPVVVVKPPVLTPPVVVVKPPVVVGPRPGAARVRFCGTERRHAAHQFRGRGGVIYHCPGKGVPAGPPGPPRRP